jgi:hypothetical protein
LPLLFFEIIVGDPVVTRQLTNTLLKIEPNQLGTVEAIRENAEFGNLFVVKLENGRLLTCPRSALRKCLSSER